MCQKRKSTSSYKQQTNINYRRSVVKLFKNKTKKEFKIHRLVAEAFIPNPNNYKVVNHIDGNPLNNIVDNLEWCSQKMNVAHAINHELSVHRINTIDRTTMIELLNNNFSYDEIAQTLGIAKGTVFNYIRKFNIKKIYE
ncbi:hypothetical protein FDF76_12995 [Clostridium botulinum]|nr:hypothetical protein [Clostridium botulinum]NFF37402.1 hypothetical protein [Clostridium botulinum]NFI49514.1 hypothetical protein [Clostridium botulinum]NFI60091.1 hypothetical protein [Clostridium botulinum]NFI69515.1 hypothetical protein [Clostridium botulinum]